MFPHILAPLDGSPLAERALPHVVTLAQAYQSEVTLLRVLDPIGAVTRPRSVDPLDWQIRRAEADAYLKGLSSWFQDRGLRVSTDVREGKAAESVIELAGELDASLIVLSSHGQSGISGWNISSVVHKIILRAQTSVMIVRAYQAPQQEVQEIHYERILIPLDGSQRAECVLSAAQTLAHKQESELMIAHVVQQPEMPRRTPLTAEDIELAQKVVERNRVEAARYLDEVKNRLEREVDARLLVHDSVIAALHELTGQAKIDLIMMSAHGYTGGTKWPYGALVISFIAYGSTPLIIIQDLPRDRMEPTEAEMAAREHSGR
jgi:nucleotide-binding universal stress UspA family protein